MEGNVSSPPEQRQESGQGCQKIQVSDDIETTEHRLDAITLSQNKTQKKQTDTPSQQMVQILKESAELRKRKYKEKIVFTHYNHQDQQVFWRTLMIRIYFF